MQADCAVLAYQGPSSMETDAVYAGQLALDPQDRNVPTLQER